MKHEYIKQIFTNFKKLKDEGIYLSGIEKEGEYKQWYGNGKLATYIQYKNGKRHGEYRLWTIDGRLNVSCNYKDDKEEGEYRKFKKDGSIEKLIIYKNGKRVNNS